MNMHSVVKNVACQDHSPEKGLKGPVVNRALLHGGPLRITFI